MINPLIISRLIEADFTVFLPIDGEKSFVIISKDTGMLIECIALNAAKDAENAPFIKVEGITTAIACVDKTTRTVWFLPRDCYKPSKILRLGKNYEEFIIPEPNSLSYQEQKAMRKKTNPSLLLRAKEIAERMHKGIE